MTEIDYTLEIINVITPIHALANLNKENIKFWQSVKKLGEQAQEVLDIAGNCIP